MDLDSAVECAMVAVFIRLLDVTQIDFAAADEHADQTAVIGSQSLHGRLQSLGKVVSAIPQALHCIRKIDIY